MTRLVLSALLLGSLAFTTVAQAAGEGRGGDDRLMIVNGNNGRVIYDDGQDDLFCVTRKKVVGYSWDGYPIYRRVMRCR
jgi:hypothetical protein